jgi:DNA-binding NarL/FixJ family response regulator
MSLRKAVSGDENLPKAKQLTPRRMINGDTNAPQQRAQFSPSLFMLEAESNSQMKAPQTKRKRKMKTKTRRVPVENPLASLGLTARETEVLTWIAQGKTNYEIGIILSACTGTICKHVERILCKLRVKNRTSAAAIAFATLGNGRSISSSRTKTRGRASFQLAPWE